MDDLTKIAVSVLAGGVVGAAIQFLIERVKDRNGYRARWHAEILAAYRELVPALMLAQKETIGLKVWRGGTGFSIELPDVRDAIEEQRRKAADARWALRKATTDSSHCLPAITLNAFMAAGNALDLEAEGKTVGNDAPFGPKTLELLNQALGSCRISVGVDRFAPEVEELVTKNWADYARQLAKYLPKPPNDEPHDLVPPKKP